MNTLILQIPRVAKIADGHFTGSYDSTVGINPGYYWFAASFLLFIAVGVVKAY